MSNRLRTSAVGVALGLTTAALVVAPAPPAHAQEVCGKWATVPINGKQYVAQNNVWGADTSQCIDVDGTSFTVTTSEHNNTGGTPAAYPSIFRGCHWENCTTDTTMPIQVDSIGSATSSWNVDADAAGSWNVAYDLWFKTNSTPGAPDGTELMIWLDSQGGVRPAGSMVDQDVPIAGATWDVWRAQMDWNYIAYQRNSSTSSASGLDLDAFVDDAVDRGAIQPSWYLMAIEAGFEIWQDGDGLATNSFSTTVGANGNGDGDGDGDGDTTPPGTECEVGYNVQNQWNTGFTASMTITNTGDSVNGWSLEFDFPAGQQLTNGWGATWNQSGTHVTASNKAWNATLAGGESVTVGFNASYAGTNPEPTRFALNDTACTAT